jgi:response regulator RpfG family c-di-GMP phosphodiesterase
MRKEDRLRVLCVDDEKNVLEGLHLHLRRHYDVVTAPGAEKGLEALREQGPFAIVLSDMRMPGMDGATFLGQVRRIAPETVRMLLTGQTDLTGAIAAVNEGQLFRFLIKPCPPRVLLDAFAAAAEQYYLITAERVLLEQTLHGSIAALVDVLTLASPAAFGRVTRVKRYVSEVVVHLKLDDPWRYGVAAMLSQVGCIILPQATAEKVYYGRELTPAEQEMVNRLPALAQRLVAHIPRMEAIGEMLACQQRRYDGSDRLGDLPVGEHIPLGARILKIAHDFDVLITQGVSSLEALAVMRTRSALVRSQPAGDLRQPAGPRPARCPAP